MLSTIDAIIDFTADVLPSDLSTLDDWLRANQLSVNPTKTKYILFAKRPNLTDEYSLFINDETLDKVKSTKFLGLHIDECFSWEDHIGVLQEQNCKRYLCHKYI